MRCYVGILMLVSSSEEQGIAVVQHTNLTAARMHDLLLYLVL
jgi:hypothetical protein